MQEKIIKKGSANWFHGFGSKGGHLILTDKTLYFEGHKLNAGEKEYEVELSNIISGKIAANAENKIVNLEIGWCWPYETVENGSFHDGDIQDTLDGSTIYNSKYSFDVTITCTQDIPKV